MFFCEIILHSGIETYITNRFKKAIEESGITGIELIPSRKLFKTRG
jgi:hypothetical protein